MVHQAGGVYYCCAKDTTNKKLMRKKDIEYKDSTQSFSILSPYINNIYTHTTTSYLASLNAFRAWLTWRSTDTLHKSQSVE